MDHYKDVKEFQEHTPFKEGSLDLSDERRLIERARLIAEEFAELMAAMGFIVKGAAYDYDCGGPIIFDFDDVDQSYNCDYTEVLKELCDLAYVTEGTAAEFGFDYNEARKRVHESNLIKVKNVQYDNNGKLIKPKGYKKPDLSDLV